MFYVYILYSAPFDKFYIGHTDNLENRLWCHNNTERSTFTSKYRPWTLIAAFETNENRADAILIEKKLKQMKSKVMLKRIVEGVYPDFIAQLVIPNK
jgi:putative endonuclease